MNSEKICTADQRMQLRFMDEFFCISKNIGQIAGCISLRNEKEDTEFTVDASMVSEAEQEDPRPSALDKARSWPRFEILKFPQNNTFEKLFCPVFLKYFCDKGPRGQIWWKFWKFQKYSKKYWNMSGSPLISDFGIIKNHKNLKKKIRKSPNSFAVFWAL